MDRLCPVCLEFFTVSHPRERAHPQCREQRESARQARRGSTAARGLTGAHRRMSEKFKREGRECVYGDGHVTPSNPITAGHIVRRADGGLNDESNYQPECRRCNSQRWNR